MSYSPLPPPKNTNKKKLHIAIVASRFNEEHVDALIDNCIQEIDNLSTNTSIHIYRVPGSFEIPLATQTVLEKDSKLDAIICLGLIVEGETSHGSHIALSITQQLLQISLNKSTPVIHEVLTVKNSTQAHERCFGEEINRGVEAARAAIGIIQTIEQINK